MSAVPPGQNAPDIDVGALAGSIQSDACDRLATTIVRTINGLHEAGRELDERQQIELVQAALQDFDGFEREVARAIRDDLVRNGVAVSGLPSRLEDLAPVNA